MNKAAGLFGCWFICLISLLVGCSKPSEPESGETPQLTSCVDCHTNQASLVATAAPDTTIGGGQPGEG